MRFITAIALFLTTFLPRSDADQPEVRRAAQERMQPEHLQATHKARMQFTRDRVTLPNLGAYDDFRAVLHIHAEDSNHTKGTRAEVLAAAKRTGVQVVMLTDHGTTRPETWRGLREGVLFMAGEEDSGAGLLRFRSTEGKAGAEGELRFLCHVEERYDAPTDGLTGIEICNRHTDAILDKGLEEYVRRAAADPLAWQKLVESFKAYPDEIFAAGTDYRARIFEKWDSEISKRPLTGIGANDAHQNQIFGGVTFDPYEVSFRNVCTHILARELTEGEIRQALRDGHVYVAHDWLCDPTGFVFGAVNTLGVFPMGDPAVMVGNTRLVGLTPLPARLKLVHDGRVVDEKIGTNLTFAAKEPGPYRLEAWLNLDGEERPWIYSNPVYLRAPSLTDLRLPSMELAPSVEVRKNISYTSGKPEDTAKHELDVYVPKNAKAAPVLFFIHGGAWRSGDRSQYVPLGNRFARQGIVTVVPSYRLAPKNPHPAQIEDVAAAFAWTVRNIEQFGGATNRIYVSGHSAGGHLAALLVLDRRNLAQHQLSPQLIRGVAALSGVYDLSSTEGQTSVFGKDPQVRRDASPLFHIQPGAPPFLITYCQWDYPSLPGQARQFDAALQKAGAATTLVFVPRQSHISEMVNVSNDDDVTAGAMLKLIRAGNSGH